MPKNRLNQIEPENMFICSQNSTNKEQIKWVNINIWGTALEIISLDTDFTRWNNIIYLSRRHYQLCILSRRHYPLCILSTRHYPLCKLSTRHYPLCSISEKLLFFFWISFTVQSFISHSSKFLFRPFNYKSSVVFAVMMSPPYI